MKYLTGKDYPHLCKSCRNSIDDAHMLIVDGLADESYTIDNEGPTMMAYDKRWFCEPECPPIEA